MFFGKSEIVVQGLSVISEGVQKLVGLLSSGVLVLLTYNHVNAEVLDFVALFEVLLHLLHKVDCEIFGRAVSFHLQEDRDPIFNLQLQVQVVGVIIDLTD